MRRILARILDSHFVENHGPIIDVSYYEITYSNLEAIREGDTSTPHEAFMLVPESQFPRPVKKGDILELLYDDSGAYTQLKHMKLKEKFERAPKEQLEMSLEGGYVKQPEPRNLLDKAAKKFKELTDQVGKGYSENIHQQYAFGFIRAA